MAGFELTLYGRIWVTPKVQVQLYWSYVQSEESRNSHLKFSPSLVNVPTEVSGK